jgi:hypothetical protein
MSVVGVCRWLATAALWPGLATAAGTVPGTVPEAGDYEGSLCVAASQNPLQCGPADVRWDGRGRASVRIHDLDYQMWLSAKKIIVILMQESMQIQDFDGAYAWRGNTLQFDDTGRQLRYEVRLGTRKP